MNHVKLLLLSLGSLCWATTGTAQTAPSNPLSYDAAAKTVTFALEAGAPGTAGPFNFNGYSNGAATLTVPPASTVVMNFVNLDGTPHSAEIIADKDPMPNMGGGSSHSHRVHQRRHSGAAARRDRRHALHRATERELPDLLRRPGAWIVGDVDPVQSGPGGQVAELGDVIARTGLPGWGSS